MGKPEIRRIIWIDDEFYRLGRHIEKIRSQYHVTTISPDKISKEYDEMGKADIIIIDIMYDNVNNSENKKMYMLGGLIMLYDVIKRYTDTKEIIIFTNMDEQRFIMHCKEQPILMEYLEAKKIKYIQKPKMPSALCRIIKSHISRNSEIELGEGHE
jgi:hypothetical protein